MSWIHLDPNWPAFTWDAASLATQLAAVRHRQGRLLGRMERLGFDLQREASLQTLTSDVVTSSAIENERLSAQEVRSSLARRLGMEVAGLVPVSRHVDGVVEMMLDATQNHKEPLTAERLFGWHGVLFPTGRSGLRRITVAAWRPITAGPMQVVSGPPDRERIHFEAPSADRVADEMMVFLKWFDDEEALDPVVKAALAHFWFVTIHPFEDGNGRIARAIADMALARSDGTEHRFYSMSAQIEAERSEYYKRLERQQRGGIDVTGWLDWFLQCLGRSLDRAEESLDTVLAKAAFWDRANRHGVNERQRLVLNRLLDGFKGHLTTSKYAKLAKCSTDTALRDIRELLAAELLVKNSAGGRSISYALAGMN